MFESMFAEKMRNLGTESAFVVFARAKQLEAEGHDVIHFEIGEPDFDTPANIIRAAEKALNSGYTHYTPAAGIPAVREAIAGYIKDYKGVETNIDEIVIVPGGKPIMFFTIMALVNPGDEVLYPDPGFPIYESVIRFVGGVPVPLPIREENGFRLDVAELRKKISPKTKLLILNSPANPTGGVLTGEDVRGIADAVRGKNIFVLSDEIYDRIIYEGQPVSIASMPGMKDWTIILDGFSKTYAMTGWRLGYGVMHHELADKVTQLMINSNSCTAAFIQMAGMEALTGPQDEAGRMVVEFKKRRDIMVEGMNSIKGIRCAKPQGAFYVFPNITGTGMSSDELSTYLLNDAKVATLSGTAFGRYGEGYLRLSYANSVENIERALERLNKAVTQLLR
ncbi:MAG: Aspartate aminotransferase [Firmicutes bacterium]|nr:Aspartate aminotransferase [Bacillota bacterium]MDI6705366.1 pyridoxal phosphate-dependent aminotransferase [Bacillota bacterium]